MSAAPPLAIWRTGLVTSVGLSAPTSCAALRAKLTNPTQTRFIDSHGALIMAHQVELEQPWRGATKLAKMAARAIDEALDGIERTAWREIPLLLCVAERERPGRLDGFDERLVVAVAEELGADFHPESAVVANGRVGVAFALARARQLVHECGIAQVLVAATDSLLERTALAHYERELRLLTESNSNGFMPGEGAGALIVGRPGAGAQLLVTGLGFAVEPAHVQADEPLRAEGLTQAIRAALADAGAQMHDLDFRITDLSGEQYYFKEAALALSRTMRQLKDASDLWHPAECIGEAGAAGGVAVLAAADAACRRAYSKGGSILAHWAADSGQRAAATLRWHGG